MRAVVSATVGAAVVVAWLFLLAGCGSRVEGEIRNVDSGPQEPTFRNEPDAGPDALPDTKAPLDMKVEIGCYPDAGQLGCPGYTGRWCYSMPGDVSPGPGCVRFTQAAGVAYADWCCP